MKDRISKHPGRVQLVPVPGQDGYFDVIRADEPIEYGSELNKANLLPDELVAHLGMTQENPQVKDAFRAVLPLAGGNLSGAFSARNISQTDFGYPIEIGKYIDFHQPRSSADYDGRLSLDDGNSGLLFNGSSLYGDHHKPCVSGLYVGDGGKSRGILLPFRPSAVLVYPKNGVTLGNLHTLSGMTLNDTPFKQVKRYGGFAVAGSHAADDDFREGDDADVYITDNAFCVWGGGSGTHHTNDNGRIYHYIAWR